MFPQNAFYQNTHPRPSAFKVRPVNGDVRFQAGQQFMSDDLQMVIADDVHRIGVITRYR